MESARKYEILIVDDHPVVRAGLAALLQDESDMTVAGQVGSSFEALQFVMRSPPDMVIADIALGDSNGLELVQSINKHDPNLPVLVLSMHDELLYAERAFRAGAQGYLMKSEAAANVVDAIRTVLSGRRYASEKVKDKLIYSYGRKNDDGPDIVHSLSNRELEVFDLIGKGYKTKSIAEKLCLSRKTIETYRASIRDKLGLRNGAELIRFAVEFYKTSLHQ